MSAPASPPACSVWDVPDGITVPQIAAALRAHGLNPREDGSGWVLSWCPFHRGQGMFLTVWTALTGKVRLKCREYCATTDVLRKLGLEDVKPSAPPPVPLPAVEPAPQKRASETLVSATRPVDLPQAAAYLTALTGKTNPAVTFQTFSDVKDPKRTKDPLARWIHGTLDEHAATLTKLNGQGAGIFVMANEGDGKGRKAVNVVRVRAVFVDQDKPPLRPFALPPSFIVRTSPGRYQAFWRVAGEVPLEDFTPMQERLAAYYGGDLGVKDLPHVVRVPGFFHRKREPVLVGLEAVRS